MNLRRDLVVLVLLVAGLAQAAAPPAQLTQEQTKQVSEAARLVAQMVQEQKAGNLAAAEATCRKILVVVKRVFGNDHQEAANALGSLAYLCEGQGKWKEAIAASERRAGVMGRLFGHGHWKAIDARWEAADTRLRAGLTPSQSKSLQRAAAMQQRVSELHQQGRAKEAIPLAKEVLEIYKKVLGDKHPHYAGSVAWLAALYQAMREHRQALPLAQQALRIYKETVGEKHPDCAISLTNLASLYQAMGEYRQSLPLLQQALRLKKEAFGEKHPDYALSLNNLAMLYSSMGEHRLALPLVQQAVRIYKESLGEKHPDYARSLNNLAILYSEMGEYRQALPLAQQALRLNKELLGEKHPFYANTLNNLASLYKAMGEYRQALPLAQQALRLSKEVLGEKHPHYAQSLNNLASLYQVMGKGGAPPVLFGQALAVLHAHVQDCLSVLSDRQRQQLLQQHAYSLEFFLSTAVGLVPAPVLFEQVAGFKDVVSVSIAEQRLARQNEDFRPQLAELQVVRAELAHHSGQTPAAADLARWRARFDELDRRKTDLEQQLAHKSAGFAQLRQKPTAAHVAARLPARTALVEFLAYRHASRPHLLFFERRLLAFVLRPNGKCVLLELGSADRLFGAVRLWRQSLADAKTAGVATSAELLRRHLWQPIAQHLDGIDTVLIAPDGDLAALPFAALPGDKPGTFLVEQYAFGYLSSGRQLLMPLSTIKGDGLLVLGGAAFGKPRPDTDPLQLSRAWSALPGAALEAEQVKDAFAARFAEARLKVLSGRRADRTRLLAALDPARTDKHWRYLHLATHGHFDPPRYALPPAVLGASSIGAAAAPGLAGLTGGLVATLVAQEPGVLNQERGFDPTGRSDRIQEANPMLLCRLVLAGVNDIGNDGYLSAEETALLNLDGCELAVLSACETSTGRQAGWQGVEGLQKGFHQAGARHVLASLWCVNDPATSVLMEEFYRLLWGKKEQPLQALRQAQLFVLRNPDKVFARAGELEKRLADSKLSEVVLLKRGIRLKAREGIAQPGKQAQSPVAWWAPWVLSGKP